MKNNENIKILVVGGAGYIGSHMVKMLLDSQYSVTTFDNLSSGHMDAVIGGDFIEGDLANSKELKKVFEGNAFDCVMHFASHIQVGESIQNPMKYYENNLINTLNLINQIIESNIKYFIFSSSAAVYGVPDSVPIIEEHNKNPINPYGNSKLMVENILTDFNVAYGLNFISLRYFNAAGCDPDGLLGERHDPETHLIPLVLQAASGKRKNIQVFGTDYDTSDGTCVRDYIHVCDLCEAHIKSMQYIMNGGKSQSINLGNGSGFSVKQIIETAKKVTKRDFEVVFKGRRAGDPSSLVADSSKARELLNWKPKYANLEEIIAHAWNFEEKYSNGGK